MIRAVHNRCFVDFQALDLPISSTEALALLKKHGFTAHQVDAVAEASHHIGRATFRLGVTMSETPSTFDCSAFTKWSYGRKGVWLPRLAIQQFACGYAVERHNISRGDLIFTSGYCSTAWAIGHVGLYTGQSVITAMIHGKTSGVMELSLDELLRHRIWRGARRVIRHSRECATLLAPTSIEIETSDDVKYFVLSRIT